MLECGHLFSSSTFEPTTGLYTDTTADTFTEAAPSKTARLNANRRAVKDDGDMKDKPLSRATIKKERGGDDNEAENPLDNRY